MKSWAASGCATGRLTSLCFSSRVAAAHPAVAPATTALVATVSAAAAHLADCRLCPHCCGPARAEGRGICRVGVQSYVASEMLHMGEEALLRPAHAIFFSGCTATCSFCTAARFAFRPTYCLLYTSRCV